MPSRVVTGRRLSQTAVGWRLLLGGGCKPSEGHETAILDSSQESGSGEPIPRGDGWFKSTALGAANTTFVLGLDTGRCPYSTGAAVAHV